MEKNYFSELYSIDVSKKIEKKNGLSYLSWAWAWAEVKKLHPDAQYKVYENCDGWNYFTDGKTCWVKVSVTINDLEHIEYLPVMDFKNRSISFDNVTSFDVNKAIQRAATKAAARHGLGLCLYIGEDYPEDMTPAEPKKKAPVPKKEAVVNLPVDADEPVICESCSKTLTEIVGKDGKVLTPVELAIISNTRVKKTLCPECLKKELSK